MFVVKRCANKVIYPVVGLQDFISGCKDLGVDLSYGYIFRIVTEDARVWISLCLIRWFMICCVCICGNLELMKVRLHKVSGRFFCCVGEVGLRE